VAKEILCIVGTRPEVIKMAPVIRALREMPEFSVKVLSSGQHRELLLPLIDWFELTVDADLQVMSANQSLAELTARLMRGFEERFKTSLPDLVLAQGDTTTVMCAALSCFYLNIPFGHVEAGLRTFDVRNPFPEEFNRVAVGRLAQLHFCPTTRARDNVLAEHVPSATVHLTGNTVIDALQYTTTRLESQTSNKFDHDILLTAHRRENFGAPLVEICEAVLDLCREFPGIRVLFPVHPNPNVRGTVERLLAGHPRIVLSEPLDYPDLVAAMQQARLILTDSGGIQEEAPSLGKPVLVMRETTERPEALKTGWVKLVGTDAERIVSGVTALLETPAAAEAAEGGSEDIRPSPYGDGRAAERIVGHCGGFLGGGAACR
jgi:UDP-N-acetylglucosamine 2-epimerase (non-hydrolysing)